MLKRNIGHALACLSAVIGAGFASGRELMSFFSRYGACSWFGIFLTSGAMGMLCYGLLRQRRSPPWEQLLFSMLLCVTAGAMTSAAGELFCLLWPFPGGYHLGMLTSLGLSLKMAPRGLKSLKNAGALLLPCLILMFGAGASVPPYSGLVNESAAAGSMLIKALAYAGLNMTLAAPALMEISSETNDKDRRMISAVFACMLLLLLAMGNKVLLRHPELESAPLPMVALLRNLDGLGFTLCAVTLYTAVFSTLLAVHRGMYLLWQPRFNSFALPLCAITTLITAASGFERLVSTAYPILGLTCLALLPGDALWQHLNKRRKCAKMPTIKS